MDYKMKYLKYKSKYIMLKQMGGDSGEYYILTYDPNKPRYNILYKLEYNELDYKITCYYNISITHTDNVYNIIYSEIDNNKNIKNNNVKCDNNDKYKIVNLNNKKFGDRTIIRYIKKINALFENESNIKIEKHYLITYIELNDDRDNIKILNDLTENSSYFFYIMYIDDLSYLILYDKIGKKLYKYAGQQLSLSANVADKLMNGYDNMKQINYVMINTEEMNNCYMVFNKYRRFRDKYNDITLHKIIKDNQIDTETNIPLYYTSKFYIDSFPIYYNKKIEKYNKTNSNIQTNIFNIAYKINPTENIRIDKIDDLTPIISNLQINLNKSNIATEIKNDYITQLCNAEKMIIDNNYEFYKLKEKEKNIDNEYISKNITLSDYIKSEDVKHKSTYIYKVVNKCFEANKIKHEDNSIAIKEMLLSAINIKQSKKKNIPSIINLFSKHVNDIKIPEQIKSIKPQLTMENNPISDESEDSDNLEESENPEEEESEV